MNATWRETCAIWIKSCQWYIIKNRCEISELLAVMSKIGAAPVKYVIIPALIANTSLSVGYVCGGAGKGRG
jgi:hypothetical protein